MTRTHKFWVALAIIGIIILGFLREFIFVHINAHLFALWYEEPSEATDLIPFMKQMDYYPLYYSKWILTVVFAVLFYAATAGVLKVIFNRYFWRELGAIYIVLLVFAGFAMSIGALLNATDEAYTIARFLMGIAQSPLLLMVMIPGVLLRRQLRSSNLD